MIRARSKRRHARCLANIERLEIELGYRQDVLSLGHCFAKAAAVSAELRGISPGMWASGG